MALIICSKFVTKKLIEGKTVQFLPAQKKKKQKNKKTKKQKIKKTKIPATSLLFVEEHNCDTQLMGYINTKINVIFFEIPKLTLLETVIGNMYQLLVFFIYL